MKRAASCARALFSVAVALAGVAAVYMWLVRPRHLRWGATDEEAIRRLPGDGLIPEPASRSTRAVTIDAPPADVWPWIVQIGQGRGGFYSYDWLENLFGCDINSADRVHAEWQHLRKGEELRLAAAERFPESYLIVEEVDAPRLLLLRSVSVDAARPDVNAGFSNTWSFHLEPANGHATRIIARAHYGGPPLIVLPIEALQFIMERGMLLGLKKRVKAAKSEAA